MEEQKEKEININPPKHEFMELIDYEELEDKKVLSVNYNYDSKNITEEIILKLENNCTLSFTVQPDCCNYPVMYDTDLSNLIGDYIFDMENVKINYEEEDLEGPRSGEGERYEELTQILSSKSDNVVCLSKYKITTKSGKEAFIKTANATNGYYPDGFRVRLVKNYTGYDTKPEPDPNMKFIFNLEHGYQTTELTNLMLAVINDDLESTRRIMYNMYKPNLGNDYCNKQTKSGHAAIHLAVINNRVRILKILLSSYRFNINLQTANGFTPINLACHYKLYECCELLLVSKPDLSIANSSGVTPLMNADIKILKLIIGNFDNMNNKEITYSLKLILDKLD